MKTISKNASGYGYKYADLSQVNEYIAKLGESYHQYVETKFNPITGEAYDYIHTVRIKGDTELDLQGCRVIEAELNGKTNSAQQAGSGLTYARRYSLYMAYGLATEDDDGESFTKQQPAKSNNGIDFDEYRKKCDDMTLDELRKEYVLVNTSKQYSDKQKGALKKIIEEVQESKND